MKWVINKATVKPSNCVRGAQLLPETRSVLLRAVKEISTDALIFFSSEAIIQNPKQVGLNVSLFSEQLMPKCLLFDSRLSIGNFNLSSVKMVGKML